MATKKKKRKTKLNRHRLEAKIIEVCGSIQSFLDDRSVPLHKNTKQSVVADAEIRETEGRTKLAPFLGVSWEYMIGQVNFVHEFDDSVINELREIAERDLILGRNDIFSRSVSGEFCGHEWLGDLANSSRRLHAHTELYEVIESTLSLLTRDGLIDHAIEKPGIYVVHSYSRAEIVDIAMDRAEYEFVLVRRSRENLRKLSPEARKDLVVLAWELTREAELRVRTGLSFRKCDHAVHRMLVGIGRRPETAIKFIDSIEHNDRPYMTFRRLTKLLNGVDSSEYGDAMEKFNKRQLNDHRLLLTEMLKNQRPRLSQLRKLITEHATRMVVLWEDNQVMLHQLRRRLA